MVSDLISINKILLVLISTSGIFLACWVYFADRKNKVNQLFFGFTLSAIAWMSLDYATSFPSLFPYALLMARIEWAFIAVFIIFAYFFSIYFPRESKRYPVLDRIIIGVEIIFFLLCLFTDTVIENIEPSRLGGVRYVLGKGGIINLITMIPFAVVVLFNIFKKYFTLSRLERLRVQYFLIGLSIYAIANLIFNIGLMLFLKEYPQTISYIGASSAIFLFGFTAYAIVKRELFGIKVILTDFLVGLMGIILLIFPFVMPTIFLRILSIAVFLIFCIFGYYLIRAVREEEKRRQEAESLAERETKMREEAERFKKISVNFKERISQVLDLKEVISHILEAMIEALGVSKISFALKQPVSEFFQFHKTIGFIEKELASIIRDTSLCPYLEKTKKILLRENLTSIVENIEDKYYREELEIIQKKMIENEISLIFPLFQKQNLIGIIYLGPRSSQTIYSKEDIDLLEALSYQISISLNNALLYEEIKKDKEYLEKFYKLTVGRELKTKELKQKIAELEKQLEEKK